MFLGCLGKQSAKLEILRNKTNKSLRRQMKPICFGKNPRLSIKTNQLIYLLSQGYVLPTFFSIICVQVPSSRGILSLQLFILVVPLILHQNHLYQKSNHRTSHLALFIITSFACFIFSVQIGVPSVSVVETFDFELQTVIVWK